MSGASRVYWDAINRRKRERLMRKVSKVHIDFETRSVVDLPDTGVYVYAQHPSTDAWCLAYALDDDRPKVWTPPQPFPDDLRAALAQGAEVLAHNANFEWVIWNVVMVPRHGWPRLPLEQLRCTMAMAYAMSLPGSLDKAAAALGLKAQKDMAGHRLMLQVARPRRVEPDGTVVWWNEPEKLNRLYAYCAQDLETERELSKRVRPLSSAEQAVWVLDQKINARGVGVDEALCRKALKIVHAATADLDNRMRRTTGNAVTACSNTTQLRNWVKSRGVECTSVNKEALADLLGETELPDDVRAALELRREAAKTSTAKIETLLTGLSKDGRARGLLQYHAASTGRWAGRRFQPQNLPRPKLKKAQIPLAIESLKTGSYETVAMVFDEPLSVVSDCIRSLLAAGKGRELSAGDFSNIEGRVIAWWAGEHGKIRAFKAYDAGTGPDLYKVAAGSMFGIPASAISDEDPRRQIGKVAELACGYQGGVSAFLKMAGAYSFRIEEQHDTILAAAKPQHVQQALESYAKAQRKPSKRQFVPAEAVKLAWRDANPAIVSLWYKAEDAMTSAVTEPGKIFAVGPVRWRVSGSFLWCSLPNGRLLCYPYPKVEERETPWGDKKPVVIYKGVNSYTRKWEDISTYGGKVVENVVQAIARDFMADAMLRLEAAGYPVILTVHDEVVTEPAADFGSYEEFKRLMEIVPPWGAGCPISVGGWRDTRYRK